jgi:FKBP-type peptidyl-prolyl cis-trans isomerase SlyD
MLIDDNTVVTIHYELSDTDGAVLSASTQAMSYLHGGYGAVFATVERALHGKAAGHEEHIPLAPRDAFGEIDRNLLRAEPRDRFPPEVSAGLRFQGRAADDEDPILYTVIAVTEDSVVVDGNHPLAGRHLRFKCRVEAVRAATAEEIAAGRAIG